MFRFLDDLRIFDGIYRERFYNLMEMVKTNLPSLYDIGIFFFAHRFL